MKKILLFTFITFLSISFNSNASGACLIKDKSAQVLLDYIKDNRKVIENISSGINNSNAKIDNKFITNFNTLEGSFNEIFNFSGYESYAKYFAIFPISNDVPYEIKRDYQILADENEGLQSYLQSLNSSGYGKVIILNPCEGISTNCNYENLSASKLVGQLTQNIDKVLNLYRLTVMGDNIDIKSSDLQLVNNNFIFEIEKHYNKKSLSACSDSEGGFFEQIKKSISNIKLLNKEGKDGIQKWKDAWQLLIGNKPNKEIEIEKQVLKDELKEKGISTDYHNIIQTNLDDYNLEGLSTENNFLTNTYDLIKKNIETELKEFKEELLYDELDSRIGDEPGARLSIDGIKKLEQKAEITKRIQEKISIIYNNELPFAAIGEISTKKLRAKIIDSHFYLDKSIKTLDETKPKSENICKSQGGGGKCTTN